MWILTLILCLQQAVYGRFYTVDGYEIFLDKSESHMMSQRTTGSYEKAKREFMKGYLKEGMTFIDVGANHGYHGLLAAKLVGSSGEVLMFEPVEENLTALKLSIKKNGFTNCKTFPIALYDRKCIIEFSLGKKSGWGSLKPDDRNTKVTRKIRAKTLDSIVGNSKVDVIKIDVQGSELEVLKGAKYVLSNNHNIVLLLDVDRYNVNEISKFLGDLGFSFYREQYPLKTPITVTKLSHVIVKRKEKDANR